MHLFRIGSIIRVLHAAVKHHQTMNAFEAAVLTAALSGTEA